MPRLSQKPEGVAGGNPVGAVVFGVAVAGDHAKTGREGFVHLADIILIQEVVGVENEIAVKISSAVLLHHLIEQELEGIALAHPRFVLPHKDRGAGLLRDGGRPVGAVVRHHKDRNQLGRIFLSPDAFDQLADHCLLIPGRDHNRIPVGHDPRRAAGCLLHRTHQQIEKLIRIAEHKDRRNDKIGRKQIIHCQSPSPDSGVFIPLLSQSPI